MTSRVAACSIAHQRFSETLDKKDPHCPNTICPRDFEVAVILLDYSIKARMTSSLVFEDFFQPALAGWIEVSWYIDFVLGRLDAAPRCIQPRQQVCMSF